MKTAYIHVFEQTDTEGRKFEQIISTTDRNGKGSVVKMYLGFLEPGLFSLGSIQTLASEWNDYEASGDHPTGFSFSLGDYVPQPKSLSSSY